jgi:hypothetical protein
MNKFARPEMADTIEIERRLRAADELIDALGIVIQGLDDAGETATPLGEALRTRREALRALRAWGTALCAYEADPRPYMHPGLPCVDTWDSLEQAARRVEIERQATNDFYAAEFPWVVGGAA